MTAVETDLLPFSSEYRLTEFDVEVTDAETVQIARGRYEDIEYWWSGADVPVVLKIGNRNYVPEPSKTVPYDQIRLPEYMLPAEWGFPPDVTTALVASEAHTRLVMGFS